MVNEISIRNLQPFAPGIDVRRHKGGMPSLKVKIRKFLDGVTLDDEHGKITYEEKIILEAMRETIKPESSDMGRKASREFLFGYVYGKPLQRGELKLEGELNVTGKLVSDLSDAEQDHILANIERYDQLPDGTVIEKIQDAEFTDEVKT